MLLKFLNQNSGAFAVIFFGFSGQCHSNIRHLNMEIGFRNQKNERGSNRT